jgi:hypothetical protein
VIVIEVAQNQTLGPRADRDGITSNRTVNNIRPHWIIDAAVSCCEDGP